MSLFKKLFAKGEAVVDELRGRIRTKVDDQVAQVKEAAHLDERIADQVVKKIYDTVEEEVEAKFGSVAASDRKWIQVCVVVAVVAFLAGAVIF